ncbi:MAG: hypothetical protein AAFP04_01910 [Myxococcota bacterium]
MNIVFSAVLGDGITEFGARSGFGRVAVAARADCCEGESRNREARRWVDLLRSATLGSVRAVGVAGWCGR